MNNQSKNIKVDIRPIKIEDRAQWEKLWEGYLDSYQTNLDASITDNTWNRIHDVNEPVYALGAYDGDKLIGFAQFLYHISTWTPKPFCYLHDLFTDPAYRGNGIGRTLIEAVVAHAKSHNSDYVHWLTMQSNKTAQALYNKIAENDGFIQYNIKIH